MPRLPAALKGQAGWPRGVDGSRTPDQDRLQGAAQGQPHKKGAGGLGGQCPQPSLGLWEPTPPGGHGLCWAGGIGSVAAPPNQRAWSPEAPKQVWLGFQLPSCPPARSTEWDGEAMTFRKAGSFLCLAV